jgi:dihydrofolate reductase
MKKIAIIAAIANNNAIGKNGNLLIHLPKDLKWFKQNTVNHTVVMGRKTYESLPNGALPNRKNIVLTRNKDFHCPDCTIASSIDEALKHLDNQQINFIIGGAEIYKLFLPLAQRLIITRIYADFDADTFFPEIDFEKWQIIEKIENQPDKKNNVKFDFITYLKK